MFGIYYILQHVPCLILTLEYIFRWMLLRNYSDNFYFQVQKKKKNVHKVCYSKCIYLSILIFNTNKSIIYRIQSDPMATP